VKSFSWRWLVLATAVPACVLIQPLDKAVPDSSGTAGDSEAGSLGSAGKHPGSAGSGTDSGGASAAAGATGEAGAGGSAGGSAPNGGSTAAPSGGTTGTAGASAPSGGAGTTSTTCKPPGGVCTQRADCCQSGANIPTANGATCDTSDHLCHANCTDGAQCNSGCCLPLAGTNYGSCEVSAQCSCLPESTTCNPQAPNQCCGGSVGGCYPGDSKCHRLCLANADCPSGCCDTSLRLCAPSSYCGR